MGLIWNLVALVKNAKQAAGAVQKVQGQTAGYLGAINRFQNTLVQKDYDRALSGNSQAQFEMGERFFQGLGVPKDYSEAAAWFQQAAHKGHPKAQRILAMMFFLGRGVAADPAEAYKWIQLASLNGEEDTLHTKRTIASKITAEAMVEGEKRAAAM
jgi:TPR repeat protein